MLARFQAYKIPLKFNPSFLFEGTSAEGPAASSSSHEPIGILPLDVIRSTVTSAKS